MSWNSWPMKFWSNQQTVLDQRRNNLKVEFLTQEEKIKKDIALTPLLEQADNYPETLIPYEQHFKCSFRFIFKAPQKTTSNLEYNQISLKQIMGNILLSTDKENTNFYQTYINGIKLIMKDNQSLTNDDMIDLYNQTEINSYEPSQILEIIYYEKSLWERIKNKTSNAVKKIPSLMISLIEKLVGLVLMLLGLNGGMTSIVWKFIPSKKIVEWIVMIVTIFFPFLGPILGIGKMLL